MYTWAGCIENRSLLGIYCAYSAPNPNGGDDIWKVSILNPGKASDGIDIDYIRTTDDRNYLCWAGGFGGIVKNPAWKSNKWIKVRQLVTTEIQLDRNRPKFGFLYMMITVFGTPADALREAKTYDGGWREASRGTTAVNAAISEWEDLIKNGSISQLPTRYL